MDIQDPQNYEMARAKAQNLYKNIEKMFSPALKDWIYFTSEGFDHLIFTGPRIERKRSEQIIRFALLSLAVKLIRISTTYQEFEEKIGDITFSYWGIIAIMEGRKIKVILRKIGNEGIIHFWSVIPAWKAGKKRDEKLFKKLEDESAI